MYESHFGLRHRPFRATPDSGCYYPATGHEQALQRLLRALAEGEGPVLLTGAPGTGKTLLCHGLLERLEPDTSTAFLTQGHFGGRAGLLQSILYDLSLPHEGRGEQELRLTLTDHLLRNYAAGKRAVVVVDEAHHLSPDLLEELRLLGNLEAGRGQAVQVVLAGQPALLVTLGRPDLASLSQRLAVRAEVEPLSLPEAADYLAHRVRRAGGVPDDVLAGEARELLARGSGGVPRLLNQAAHEALMLACAAGVKPVDAEAALEALALLGLDVPEDEANDEKPLAA
ncbi:MAG TPA: AAA family ATPase [Gemmataceae bacterium]|nr:AAA family ATPase [Gemmataceae bacterium]